MKTLNSKLDWYLYRREVGRAIVEFENKKERNACAGLFRRVLNLIFSSGGLL